MQIRMVLIPALTLAFAPGIRAGSVDNRNNNSADYIRSVSRNAATDGGDVAIYNPAGTVRLQDGLLVSLNNQTVAKYNRHKLIKPDVGYESNIVSPLYPTGFAVYKRDNWAAFGGFSFPGGGGELDYAEGSATVFPIQTNLQSRNPPQDADAYLRSLYYGGTVGGAYAISEKYSVSLAARVIYARTDITVDAGVDLPPRNSSKVVDHMEEARGVGAVLGFDAFPMPGLILALRLEGPTSLEWEVQRSTLNLESVIKDPNLRAGYTANLRQVLRTPGSKFQRDLPATIGLGAAYTFIPGLRADASFNYYMNTLADWGGIEDRHEDGWEAALGVEYAWTPRILTSTGVQYTISGAGPDTYQIENPALDSYTLGIGGRFKATDRIGLSAGFAANITFDDDMPVTSLGTTAGLQKDVLVTAVAIEYRAF
ncbi:MAG: rane protein involved in aromatic hydrocarbon degradation [Fibrobacteres bacterium]|nr:rane protein involved in aromatic hydrocarbon degradation [Fibrobacterota bacterium]